MARLLVALVCALWLATVAGCSERAGAPGDARTDIDMVSGDSPGMLKAYLLGKQSWAEGLELYNAADSAKGKAMLVKLAFDAPDGGREFMFAEVVGNTDAGYVAVLRSTPVNVPDWHPGDRVEFENEDVHDWVLQVEGEPNRGAFSTCQIARHERPSGNAAKHLRRRPGDCAWADEYARRAGFSK